jgi:hypothetical protein
MERKTERKNIMMRPTICALILMGGLAGSAWAGPAGVVVDGEANFAAHFDLEKFKATEAGRFILSHLDQAPHRQKLDAFQGLFRLDLRRQIHSVTLFGYGNKPDDGVAILRGEFHPDHLITLVRANDAYASSTHRSLTIHSWIDDKEREAARMRDGQPARSYGTFVSKNLLLIGKNRDALIKGIDLYAGHQPGIELAQWLGPANSIAPTASFVAGARLEQIALADPKAAILKNAQTAQIQLGEANGFAHGFIRLETQNPTVGEALKKIADGVVTLWTLKQDKNPIEAELVRSAKIEQEGAFVTISWNVLLETLKTAALEAAKQKQQ